jgi:hypothetical protein
MYNLHKYLYSFRSVRWFHSDDSTIKKSIFLPVTKFKNRLNVNQTILRDYDIFKVNLE